VDLARLGWTIALLAVVAGVVWLFRIGWKHREARQAGYPALPLPPQINSAGTVLTGVYVSTTVSGRWQDRIVTRGLGRRANATAVASPEGIRIDRTGEDPLWIPRSSLRGISTAPGIAGKVMGLGDGILILTWEWGNELVDTGFRADDRDEQLIWMRAAHDVVVTDRKGRQ
jgi:hypothetical protein